MSHRLVAVMARGAAVTVAGAALVAGWPVMAQAATGQPEPAMTARFVAAINAERMASDRSRLSVSTSLSQVAGRWAAGMSARNVLSHNQKLGREVQGWHYLGENVGVGFSVDSLVAAFWASPAHRSNILDRHYTELGVAVVNVGGKLWVAEEYEGPSGARIRAAARAASPAPPAVHSIPATPRRSRLTGPFPLNRCPLAM